MPLQYNTLLRAILASGGGGPVFIQPYNRLFILGPGDSRTAMGGGVSGTYGLVLGVADDIATSTGTSVDSALATWTGHRIRRGKQGNPGIGGETAAQTLTYPRPAQITASTASITGNVMTVTVKGGGDNFAVGQAIQGTNVTGSPKIMSLGTGTGGAGTYNMETTPDAASGSVTPYYVYGGAKTIADIAANQAAIVILWLGTNGSGSAGELTAMDNAIKGLTNPAFSYPGYGGPLPLYGGLPKTIILMNETRRGINALNVVSQQLTGGTATQFKNYAASLLKYGFDSGDALANPHVIAVDTFNDARIADTTDVSTYNPLPGLWADGLHPATTVIWKLGQIISEKINAKIDNSYSFVQLVDSTTLANFFTQNPIFATTSGGSQSIGSHTLVGTVPQGFQINTSGGASGLTITFSYNALGGNLGNELVMRVTGTAISDTTLTLVNTASAAQKLLIALGTDTLRAAARTKLQIDAGDIHMSTLQMQYQNGSFANSYNSTVGLRGIAGGYAGNTGQPMLLENAYASAEHTGYVTEMTNNVTLKDYVGSGNPSLVSVTFGLGVRGSVAVDVTITLSQVSVFKVTD
jgi:hypothetical protein